MKRTPLQRRVPLSSHLDIPSEGVGRTQVYFEGAACAVCGNRAVQSHHVIYAQHVRAHKGDVDARENLLPLCVGCHERHHTAAERIPFTYLTDENVAFARDLLGLAAFDYFTRRYFTESGDDRLYGLLEERAA